MGDFMQKKDSERIKKIEEAVSQHEAELERIVTSFRKAANEYDTEGIIKFLPYMIDSISERKKNLRRIKFKLYLAKLMAKH